MLGLEGTLYVISLNASLTDVETESQQGEKTWLQSTQLGRAGVGADLLEFFPFSLSPFKFALFPWDKDYISFIDLRD